MSSWFFEEIRGKLHVRVDGEERGEVKALRIGKKLSFIEVLLNCMTRLLLCVDSFNNNGSEVCRKMKPLKKSKVEPFCISRTKFVKRWSEFVSPWTEATSEDSDSSNESYSPLSSSIDSVSSMESDSQQSNGMESDVDREPSSNHEKGRKKSRDTTVLGIQDQILREKFLGTFDVHVSNLCAPHPTRQTRLLEHGHVGSLTESFIEQDCGQLVILVGMLTTEQVNPASLTVEGDDKVEVLGGNHTREALQSLLKKGSLSSPIIKVNLYSPLPVAAALAIGYQHNTILQEKRKPMTFIDKVRLMRHCRPPMPMSSDKYTEWKDMLVVVFRAKNRSRMMAAYQQHVNMAKLPEDIWAKAVRGAENLQVSEKFFRPLMRIDDEDKISLCLDKLIEGGKNAFNKQVKEYIEMGCVKKKVQTKKPSEQQTKDAPPADKEEGSKEEEFEAKYLKLQEAHERLKEELEKALLENSKLKDELRECKGTKRGCDSEASFTKGMEIEAIWEDEWLKARILRVNKSDYRVQYEVDNGIANLPANCIRKLPQL